MTAKQRVEFLLWLKYRLILKHKDNQNYVLSHIDEIIQELTPKPFEIDRKKIKQICYKLYPTFNFEKDETSLFDIGYSKKEKIDILNHVTNIICEYFGATSPDNSLSNG